MQKLNSPWVELVDAGRYQASVDAFARLGVTAIASCHGPAVTGGDVARAIAALRLVPTATLDPTPGQPVLDEVIAQALAAGPPPA